MSIENVKTSLTGLVVLAVFAFGCGTKGDSQTNVRPRLTSNVNDRSSAIPDRSLSKSTDNPAKFDDAVSTSSTNEPENEAPPEVEADTQLAQADTSNDRPVDINFNDLKLDIEPAARFEDAMLTDEIKKLEGKPIRIRGVMYPTFTKKGNKQFILLMNKECKFGSAKDPVWCNIRVVMDENEAADYTYDPITVEGVLHFDLMKGAKYDLSLYMMTGARVK